MRGWKVDSNRKATPHEDDDLSLDDDLDLDLDDEKL
jgi:hypothetical protein